MATIEPRLIHLLNESTSTPKPHHAELPPIKGLSLPDPTSRLHPIEPDAGQRNDGTDLGGGQLGSQSIPSLFAVTDDSPAPIASLRKEVDHNADRNVLHHVSSQDLRMILDDTHESVDDLPTKKRPVKEDFVQLPQPLKKQKAASQTNLFPPIIVGLLEPPRNAALFPPISSGSFDDRPHSTEPLQGLGRNKTSDLAPIPASSQSVPSPPTDAERTPTGKVKRKAAKPRRKWSEEETNHLLLGVSKHGVGKWTDILDDPDYKFDHRSAGDLKDRFRTCCPEELRANSKINGGGESEKVSTEISLVRPKKGLMAENILNDPEESLEPEKALSINNDSDSGPKLRKSRAHRKKLEDLAELGINGPFKKSKRRGRRPFSVQDDREILQGFELYGPQWTKIKNDSNFNLSTRQPTDLRDRLRNKYPEKFNSAQKTPVQVQEPGRSNNLLEPSVDMNIGNSLDKTKSALLEPQLNRTNSREDMPKWPLSSSLMDAPDSSQSSGFYWSDATATAFPSAGIGEMDISRLLLDDTQVMNDPPLPDIRGLG
jgi:hypothetical protein